ncbi:hypothetical protein [Roseiconus lacunae]|uniref:Uncharacterized protein n=1 Tax=Roseiconus lacunae TaxID=2605694 RepID=A0ABT7PH95_9BACT|nr:hypothetical protein [Roseiconus lacunae]MDM4015611.1 hypothetical protein [Roseiconus lacunae]
MESIGKEQAVSEGEERKSKWGDVRDLFAATREAIIVLALVLLIVAPGFVRDQLERAGITSFAGVEFGIDDVVDAGEQVALAEAEVANLAAQLASMQSKLDQMSDLGRSAKPEELREIASVVDSLKTKAASVDDSLSRTTSKIGRAIQLTHPDKLRELSERNAENQLRSRKALEQTLEQTTLLPELPSQATREPIQTNLSDPPVQSAQLKGFFVPQQSSSSVSR